MRGQTAVFYSIFVTKYRQGLGYFEDKSDTLKNYRNFLTLAHEKLVHTVVHTFD